MPFKPIGGGMYKSPSGRKFTGKQVKMYYATDGFKNMGKARADEMEKHMGPPKKKGKKKKKKEEMMEGGY